MNEIEPERHADSCLYDLRPSDPNDGFAYPKTLEVKKNNLILLRLKY